VLSAERITTRETAGPEEGAWVDLLPAILRVLHGTKVIPWHTCDQPEGKVSCINFSGARTRGRLSLDSVDPEGVVRVSVMLDKIIGRH
jgi:hypothetical protein